MTPDTASLLLDWYALNRRVLPWRASPNQKPDPYKVWLSEIMLQQTVVATVIPYYENFLKTYPTIHDLAQAPLDDILRLWAGLGYYARARNLHACAKKIDSAGCFPTTIKDLMDLPGIGAYTSRAIAAIAFYQPVVPVDGNVERLTARLRGIEEPLPKSRPLLHRSAAMLNHSIIAQNNPSDFAQALFDLGATICTPRNPSCLVCPCRQTCQGYKLDIAKDLPGRLPKAKRPTRYGSVFRVRLDDGRTLLRTRAPGGLLGGTDELPGTPWRDTPWIETEAFSFAPFESKWRKIGTVRHPFTHFLLILNVYENTSKFYDAETMLKTDCSLRNLEKSILSSVMHKCVYLTARPASPVNNELREITK